MDYKKAFVSVLLLNAVFLINGFERNQVMEGQIFRKGSSNNDLLYVQKEFRERKALEEMISHKYYKADDSLAALESVVLENGRIREYEMSLYDMGFSGFLSYNENGIELRRIQDGKEKVKTIRSRENLIVGPMLPSFVKKNLENIKNNTVVQFHLPYIERFMMIPMILKRNNSSLNNTNKTVSVEMRVKNRLLSLLIDSVELVVDSETGNVLEIHGPTILPDPAGAADKQYINSEIFYKHRGTL